MTKEKKTPLVGCDDLRGWLIGDGFRVALDGLAMPNECNWYAYRKSEIPARECECNDDKPAQIVVRPYRILDVRGAWESASVSVTGQAGGVWIKLDAYSLSHEDLRSKLGDIERSLIAAWNALLPNQAVEAGA